MEPQTIDLGKGYTKQVKYYKLGKVQSECYYLNGKLHQEYDPAVIWYYESGKIQNEAYFLNSKRHREDGPSIIDYYESGKVQREAYFLDGNRVSQHEFENLMLKRKINII